MRVDWSEIVCSMGVSTVLYKCTYCIYLLGGRIVKLPLSGLILFSFLDMKSRVLGYVAPRLCTPLVKKIYRFEWCVQVEFDLGHSQIFLKWEGGKGAWGWGGGWLEPKMVALHRPLYIVSSYWERQGVELLTGGTLPPPHGYAPEFDKCWWKVQTFWVLICCEAWSSINSKDSSV